MSKGVLLNVVNGHARSWPRLRRDLAALLQMPEAELFGDPVDIRQACAL